MNHRNQPNGSKQETNGQMHVHKEVKIIPFVLVGQLGNNIPDAERLITGYLNEGWTIEAAGGAGGDAGILGLPPGSRPEEDTTAWGIGFIVLHRYRPLFPKEWHVPSPSEYGSSNGTPAE